MDLVSPSYFGLKIIQIIVLHVYVNPMYTSGPCMPLLFGFKSYILYIVISRAACPRGPYKRGCCIPRLRRFKNYLINCHAYCCTPT